MRNRAFYFVSLLVVSCSALADHPQAEIEKLLSKMHHAAHMLNYDGTFVYGQNEQLSSMQIIHSVDTHGEQERLISLDGSGREVIRTGNKVVCILPDRKSVVIEKSRPTSEFPPAFPIKINHLAEFYDFHVMDDTRVAGRPTRTIKITPRDEYRYGHTLWVDANTGLLLKNHLLTEKGEAVEQFMFTRIDYPAKIDKKSLNLDYQNKEYTWYQATDPATELKNNESHWRVSRLPPGFEQDMQRNHKITRSTMPVEHQVFTDGLSSVSVFIEKQMKDSKNLMGGSMMGAVNAYGKLLGDYHVTVVGEVPQASVKLIGESVEYIGP